MLAGSGIAGIFLDLATAFVWVQNGDYYKTSKSQNGDYYKTATVIKRRKYKTAKNNIKKIFQNILQKSLKD